MSPKARWRDLLASLPCVICKSTGVQLHHVAEGSGLRHDYGLVPLCPEHHDANRSGSGLHGMGTERFCKLFRIPGESEYGLLILTMEAVARR